VQELEKLYDMPVIAIATLADLLAFLDSDAPAAQPWRLHLEALRAYRSRYGA
jgi:orotate phosphoribosyltransferase